MKRLFIIIGIIVAQIALAKSDPFISFNTDIGANERIKDEVLFHARNMGLNQKFAIRVNFSLKLPRGINGTSEYTSNNDFHQVLITVNRKLHRSKKIETIVHELIHAWQFIYEDLRRVSKHIVEWRGEQVDLRKVPYGKRPWEKEAYLLAEVLRKQYDMKKK